MNIEQITDHILWRIKEAQEDESTLYWDESELTPYFSWDDLLEDDHKTISLSDAIPIIQKAVEYHLKTHKKIFLYLCGDNAAVAIEDISHIPEVEDNYEKQDIPNLFTIWD